MKNLGKTIVATTGMVVCLTGKAVIALIEIGIQLIRKGKGKV